jgi:two-component system sensor histidine kinase BaeS
MSNTRILLIEDDPDIARVIETYLRRGGFDVEVVYDGPSGLERLVADLALLLRVETGQETLQLEPLAVADLLEAAASSFRPDYGVNGVVLEVAPTTGSYVQADAERTLQALTNLLDNALKHTPCGGIVTVTARAQGDVILFEVRDTGEGVAAAELPHLFTRFLYQWPPRRTCSAR